MQAHYLNARSVLMGWDCRHSCLQAVLCGHVGLEGEGHYKDHLNQAYQRQTIFQVSREAGRCYRDQKYGSGG